MAKVVQIEAYRRIWGHVYCVCVLCFRDWTAACYTSGPYECPDCHQMSGQAMERWEGPKLTLPEILQKFPMER